MTWQASSAMPYRRAIRNPQPQVITGDTTITVNVNTGSDPTSTSPDGQGLLDSAREFGKPILNPRFLS
jgi:hypothetical protein